MEISAKKKVRVLGAGAALFFVALLLTAYTSRNPSIVRSGSGFIQEGLVPFQSVYQRISSGVSGAWKNYVWLRGMAEENVELLEELHSLRLEVSRLREFEHQNEELREFLGMEKEAGLDGIIATVVGYDPTSWVQSLTINRGRKQGVEVGQAVIHPEGLVGQVITVSRSTAKVLLITDNSSGVDALIQRNRVRGVVSGNTPDSCLLQYIAREEEVRMGDALITSGMDGLFPKGIPIGTIASVQRSSWGLFLELTVDPYVSFRKLETVYVVFQDSD